MLSDVNFEDCYRFEATCPFKDCPDFQQQTIFSSPQEYQRHHCTKHEQRGNFKWKCPGCPKQNSSFYNFSAHVTGHRDLCSPPWICTLLPFKKIHLKIHHSDKETQHNHKIGICGKRSSTKNNLISHIKSVHKLNPLTYTKFNNKTFYNKKDRKLISSNRKRKRLKHETDENVSNTQYIHPESIEPKPKRIHIDNDYNQLMYLNKKLIASCLNQQNGFKSYDDLYVVHLYNIYYNHIYIMCYISYVTMLYNVYKNYKNIYNNM